MKVLMSKRATADLRAAVEWWRAHVGEAPRNLLIELREAREVLSARPHVGVEARPGIRKLLLRRAGYCLFYTVNPSRQAVTIVCGT